ncbi:hypothetical protein BCR35DRAFT_350844 [Leucosporidium creatinivorum]|uniref:F-box domain-containing protein n=1 Tax=Leucosporidium creatinivorum TaxID=106004 RepID=A0A1Y2FYH3_9BASI|nr:hypothetical protein BCR35DRAFT_350844 [Leucosporidium creatinivorum]
MVVIRPRPPPTETSQPQQPTHKQRVPAWESLVASNSNGGTMSSGGGVAQSSGEAGPSPTKKARKTGGKGKAEAVQASVDKDGGCPILSFPTDLLYETCKYLNPPSLLALSLSCKTLKGYLQSKASEPVWVVARRIVKLPQLKSDISEWFYAFLVFGQECQMCPSRKSLQFEHNLQLRLCLQCLKTNLVLKRDVQAEDGADFHAETFKCLPFTPYRPTTGDPRRDKQVYYHYPDIQKMSDKLVEFEEHSAAIAAVEESEMEGEEEDGRDETVLEAFVREQKARVNAINEDAKTIFNWQFKSIEEDIKHEDEVIKERKKAIEAKLLAAGYIQSDFYWNGFPDTARRHLEKPKELTDAEFKKTVWPALYPTLDGRKTARLQRELADRQSRRKMFLRPYIQQLKMSQTRFKVALFPTVAVVTELPSTKLFWESDDTVLDATTWSASRHTILDEIEDVMDAKRKECYLAFFPDTDFSEQAPTEAKMEAELALAVNVLKCSGCDYLFTYALACQRDCYPYDREVTLLASSDWRKSVESLLKVHKLSDKTTHDDLAKMGQVFSCDGKGCKYQMSSGRRSWEEMLHHASYWPHMSYGNRLQPLEEVQLSMVSSATTAGAGSGGAKV